jgi:hypothetical protein
MHKQKHRRMKIQEDKQACVKVMGWGGARTSEQVDRKQCSGSGIRIFLGLSDPHLDPLVTSTDTDEDPAPSLFS